jgi:UDP-3-O-[3-hydroxymyristoyl] glucosamine N-acyltransferase
MPTLRDIAQLVGAEFEGPNGLEITGLNSLEAARPGEISYAASAKYARAAASTSASAVLVGRKLKLPPTVRPIVLRVDDAETAAAKVLALFTPPPTTLAPGIDPSARVHPTAVLGQDVCVGPFVVIGPEVRVGAKTRLHPGVVIEDRAVVGEACELHPNVVVHRDVQIGNRVVVLANSVIGAEGFGYRFDGKSHVRIPHAGTVVIEDEVEIGACVCIDRAKFGQTRVGRGSRFDNLVQVGHNVVIGPMSVIASQCGIAGSAVVGAGVVMGGQTGVRDHSHIGDRAMVGGKAGVVGDVAPGAVVSGLPAIDHRTELKFMAAKPHLAELLRHVRELQNRVRQLEQANKAR